MNGGGKSDGSIVPEKPSNNAGKPAAEGVEERGPAKGNPTPQTRLRTQRRAGLQHALGRIRQAAERDREQRFTTIWHHVYDIDRLREAYLSLKRLAAPGVDGVTWQQYGETLEENLLDLSRRLQQGSFRAKAVRRVFIPKPDGRQRPIGITTLEDKIVQRATTEVLNAIYEADFLGFSYGFRPGRSQHDALDALTVGITSKKVNWVLDADIRGFFDTIDHEWMIRLIEHRIADRRVVRHLKKWLNAGVLEDGEWRAAVQGTPQGGSVSPLLANVYLHYVFDQWAHQWRGRHARGDVTLVRYADDIVVGFQYRADAERFQAALKERFLRFNLELHPEKTRLLEFGRYAMERRAKRGAGKPETFDFLGFTHCCGRTREGRFTVIRRTVRTRMRAKLKAVKTELRRRRHHPIPEVGSWLGSVIRGHTRYYGVPHNSRALHAFRHTIMRSWCQVLRRRSQRNRMTWERMGRIAKRWLPMPKICHPYPQMRLRVRT